MLQVRLLPDDRMRDSVESVYRWRETEAVKETHRRGMLATEDCSKHFHAIIQSVQGDDSFVSEQVSFLSSYYLC